MKKGMKYVGMLLAGLLTGTLGKGDNLHCLSAGGIHNLFVTSDWTVYACGYNWEGQLGDGSDGYNSYSSVPVPSIGLSNIVSVAAGAYHSLALKKDRTLWAWGDNSSGCIMDACVIEGSTNQPVCLSTGLSGIAQLAAGCFFSVALKTDGTVWAWGDNVSGQLGDGTTTERHSPVQVSGLSGIVAISALDDGMHCLALKDDGTVWAWGYNFWGQLGDGSMTGRSTPVQVKGLSEVTDVAAGCSHSVAVKSDGTVWAWGYNGGGQLGNGTYGEYNYSSTPVNVVMLSNAVEIAAGGAHSLAIKNDGSLWAWGWNGSGQLGDGGESGNCSPLPVQVNGLSEVIEIGGGYCHSIAIRNDGTVWTWGDNGSGQLGDGTTTDRSTPVQVSGLSTPTCETSPFGAEGYEPVAGDFDGDGKSDEAVYHEESGYWYVELSSSRATTYQKFGEAGYTPVSGDFDGDGKSDLAVYHESSGYWYMLLSGSSYSLSYLKFGESGYVPVPGDYDGDGKDDVAVYQESTPQGAGQAGYWYILLSGSGYSLSFMKFGESGYKPVQGDYDGDGKTDVAVYHESSTYWYIFNSSTYTLSYAQFGSSGCEPVSGDFDGDGKTDLAVYEDASAYWNIALSASGTLSTMKFGEPGYTPMPGDYDGDGKTDLATYDESTGYWYIQPSGNY